MRVSNKRGISRIASMVRQKSSINEAIKKSLKPKMKPKRRPASLIKPKKRP